MPTFFSRWTTVQLSVADLPKTTINDPKLRKGQDVYEGISNTTLEFAKASRNGTLAETPLNDSETGSHMRYLGVNEDMPFFIVHAGKDFFNPNTNEPRNRWPERVPPEAFDQAPVRLASSLPSPSMVNASVYEEPAAKGEEGEDQHRSRLFSASQHRGFSVRFLDEKSVDLLQLQARPPSFEPQALCLTVFLSKASFFRKYDAKLKRNVFHDLKIDVYVNGDLCASTYVSERYRGNVYEMNEHIVRFSGRRIGRLLEKPWVLVPPGQYADGRKREIKRSKSRNLETTHRWNVIAEALSAEAEKLGRNSQGELSVLGDYLTSLANLQMPSDVEGMQKVGETTFGVIDVVISTGKGQKDNTTHTYLTEPKSIRLKHIETIPSEDVHAPGKEVVPSGSFHANSASLETPREIHSSKNRASSEFLTPRFSQRKRSQNLLNSPSILKTDLTRNTARPSESSSASAQTSRNNRLSSRNIVPKPTETPKSTKNGYPASSTTTPGSQKPALLKLRSSLPNNTRLRSANRNFSSSNPIPTGSRSRNPTTTSSSPRTPIPHSPTLAPPPKRARAPRIPYEIVLDDKMTVAEEIANITAQAAQAEPSLSSRTTRSSLHDDFPPNARCPRPLPHRQSPPAPRECACFHLRPFR